MHDPRLKRLAQVLVNDSCRVQPGECVMLRVKGGQTALACALVDAVFEAGGHPFLRMEDSVAMRSVIRGANEQTMRLWEAQDNALFGAMQAFISIDASHNSAEHSDIPPQQMRLWSKLYSQTVYGQTVTESTRWVLCGYPTAAAAQAAGMSTEAFEDLFFGVCCLDYRKMSAAMDPLADLMAATDRVRIAGPGTDLTFSIQDLPVIKCDGQNNIPDGEIYTAPVRDSANGEITYNTPSLYHGKAFESVRFVFRDGRIIEATGSDAAGINEILDTDEGARYLGEFALGVNPLLTRPMRDTLFDEKIAGSFHLTPGKAYESCDNGNRSAIHWDLVCRQESACGGGEIWFDGVLVRKDGRFVLPQLAGLNPENLM